MLEIPIVVHCNYNVLGILRVLGGLIYGGGDYLKGLVRSDLWSTRNEGMEKEMGTTILLERVSYTWGSGSGVRFAWKKVYAWVQALGVSRGFIKIYQAW